MEKKIDITFDELKNSSMGLYKKYCDLFKQSGNTIMLLAIFTQAFSIACHKFADQLKSVNGKKYLSVGVGNGKFGNLIDFEIIREGDSFVATEPLFDAGVFGEAGFSMMDILKMLTLSMTYQPKLRASLVFECASKTNV
jgi:hypothetical protein